MRINISMLFVLWYEEIFSKERKCRRYQSSSCSDLLVLVPYRLSKIEDIMETSYRNIHRCVDIKCHHQNKFIGGGKSRHKNVNVMEEMS